MRASRVSACAHLGRVEEAGALQIVEVSGLGLMDGAERGPRLWHRDRARSPVLRPLPPSPPQWPLSPAFFFFPALSPSVKPCPEADLLQRTANLREPFLSENPHQGVLLMLAGPCCFLSPPPASSPRSFVNSEQEGRGHVAGIS